MEAEFSRLNLKENDCLVIKVDISGLSEDESIKKLQSIREDEFVKYVESKGNKVFVTYSGIDVNILRLSGTEKVLVHANVTGMTDPQTEEYLEYIKSKLIEIGEDKIIMVPVDGGSPLIKVKSEV